MKLLRLYQDQAREHPGEAKYMLVANAIAQGVEDGCLAPGESLPTHRELAEALGVLYGSPVELTIVEDDNPAMRTPLEWRQAIYEEKLAQARDAIIADNNIQTLRRFFDADLDEESIRPI